MDSLNVFSVIMNYFSRYYYDNGA